MGNTAHGIKELVPPATISVPAELLPVVEPHTWLPKLQAQVTKGTHSPGHKTSYTYACPCIYVGVCISEAPSSAHLLPTALPPVCPHHAHRRGDEEPAVFDDGPRPVADHIFNVIVETLSTCRRGQGQDPSLPPGKEDSRVCMSRVLLQHCLGAIASA